LTAYPNGLVLTPSLQRPKQIWYDKPLEEAQDIRLSTSELLLFFCYSSQKETAQPALKPTEHHMVEATNIHPKQLQSQLLSQQVDFVSCLYLQLTSRYRLRRNTQKNTIVLGVLEKGQTAFTKNGL